MALPRGWLPLREHRRYSFEQFAFQWGTHGENPNRSWRLLGPHALEHGPLVDMRSDPVFQCGNDFSHPVVEIIVDISSLGDSKGFEDLQGMTGSLSLRNNRHDHCTGVPRDSHRTWRKGGHLSEKLAGPPVLEKVPVGNEDRAFVSAESSIGVSYSRRSGFDQVVAVRPSEMRYSVEDET